jgi:hypothetical protein
MASSTVTVNRILIEKKRSFLASLKACWGDYSDKVIKVSHRSGDGAGRPWCAVCVIMAALHRWWRPPCLLPTRHCTLLPTPCTHLAPSRCSGDATLEVTEKNQQGQVINTFTVPPGGGAGTNTL